MNASQFTIPGLMEIQSPLSDAVPLIHRLPSYSRANSQWGGIAVVGPYFQNEPTVATRALMEMSLNSDMTLPFYTLDSVSSEPRGEIDIINSVSWQFSVPPQPLPLRAGLWYWTFKVETFGGAIFQVDSGRLLVRP